MVRVGRLCCGSRRGCTRTGLESWGPAPPSVFCSCFLPPSLSLRSTGPSTFREIKNGPPCRPARTAHKSSGHRPPSGARSSSPGFSALVPSISSSAIELCKWSSDRRESRCVYAAPALMTTCRPLTYVSIVVDRHARRRWVVVGGVRFFDPLLYRLPGRSGARAKGVLRKGS